MNTHSPSIGAYSLTAIIELIEKLRNVLGYNETLSQTFFFRHMNHKEFSNLYVLAAFMSMQDWYAGNAVIVVEAINALLQDQEKDDRWNFFHSLFADFASIIQSLSEQNPEMEDILATFDEKDMCLAVCNGTHAARDYHERISVPPEIVARAMHYGMTKVLDLDIKHDKKTAKEFYYRWRKPSKDEYINTYKECLTGASPLDELPTATVDWLDANCRG